MKLFMFGFIKFSEVIKQLQIIMNYNEVFLMSNLYLRKQLSETISAGNREKEVFEKRHRLSQQRAKINLIKINKSKLPNDFFNHKPIKRNSQQKLPHPQNQFEPISRRNKIETERLHLLPQTVPFFKRLQDKTSEIQLKSKASTFLVRKLQSKEQPKRDFFNIELPRKMNTAAKISKTQFLELYPSTYDCQAREIINSSKRQILRGSLKTQFFPSQREPRLFFGPENAEECLPTFNIKKTKINDFNEQTLPKNEIKKPSELKIEEMNITFFNAKSSCFPQINQAKLG